MGRVGCWWRRGGREKGRVALHPGQSGNGGHGWEGGSVSGIGVSLELILSSMWGMRLGSSVGFLVGVVEGDLGVLIGGSWREEHK